MRSDRTVVFSVLLIATALPLVREAGAQGTAGQPETLRTVAVTIDDLPVVRGESIEKRQRVTGCLLGTLTTFEIPAIGFVNEQKLGEPAAEPEEIALLEAWLDAGLDLGNHTYSHPSFFTTPLDVFEADVLRGGAVTTRLLRERGKRLRYFRHPYLNTGPDLETKAAFEAFLAQEVDSLNRDKYQQLTGKTIMGLISEDTIRKVTVNGNAEMFYFPKNKTSLIGLNRTTSSEIQMWFRKGEVYRVTLQPRTTGQIDPLKDVNIENARLKGFAWLANKRPGSKEKLRGGDEQRMK